MIKMEEDELVNDSGFDFSEDEGDPEGVFYEDD